MNGYHHRSTMLGITTHYDVEGRWHNSNGPAYYNGNEFSHQFITWWWHGERHNNLGPAVIKSDGTVEWWWHGEKVDEFIVWFRANEERLITHAV